jgi:2-oxoglutarate/2-oxoacid ferredoxin oxidoreductase subunit alpha
MDRLLKKHKASAKYVPKPIIQEKEGANFGIITLGGCDRACREAIDMLEAEGVAANYMRIRGFPFGKEVEHFIAEQDFCYVVEQNRDAQLRSLLTLETKVPKEKLLSITVYGGFPLSAQSVVEGIQLKKKKKNKPKIDGRVLMEE